MNVGIAGLGQMGGAFVERLLAGGLNVIGWNRTKAKAAPLIERGMRWADSPLELAEQSDVVFTMLANGPVLNSVLDDPRGLLKGIKGKVLIETSTIAPDQVKEIATRVANAGGALLDATVLGNHLSVEQGKLVVMTGGDPEVFARARPALDALAPKVFHLGDVGQGKVMKLALNLGLATQVLAFSEGLLMAVKSGISRDLAIQVLTSGASASPMMQYRGPLIAAQPDPAWFDCTMMQKDVKLALALGEQLQIPLPSTSLSDEWLSKAHAEGLGHHDFSILYYALTRAAGDVLEIPMASNKSGLE
jgi:3-hydroxyisobutyrate dehydrogenase-like beta-hydroxyacid dehydrogenase